MTKQTVGRKMPRTLKAAQALIRELCAVNRLQTAIIKKLERKVKRLEGKIERHQLAQQGRCK